MTTQNFDYNEHDIHNLMEVGYVGVFALNSVIGSQINIVVKLYNHLDVFIASEQKFYYPVSGSKINNLHFILSQIYQEVKRVEVTIVQSTPASNITEIGRIWIGNYLEVDFNNDYDLSHGEGAKESVSVGNDSHLHFKRPRKTKSFY